MSTKPKLAKLTSSRCKCHSNETILLGNAIQKIRANREATYVEQQRCWFIQPWPCASLDCNQLPSCSRNVEASALFTFFSVERFCQFLAERSSLRSRSFYTFVCFGLQLRKERSLAAEAQRLSGKTYFDLVKGALAKVLSFPRLLPICGWLFLNRLMFRCRYHSFRLLQNEIIALIFDILHSIRK